MEVFQNYLFIHPFTCILSGPTGSGKTILLLEILRMKNDLIDKNIDKIVYCYAEDQPLFTEFKSEIEFHKGLYEIERMSSSQVNLLIIDDFMDEASNDKSISQLFTRASHHKNISVFLLSQNMFLNGKFYRTMNLNTHYMIIFKNPRDKAQFKYLAREMFPENWKFLYDSYLDATRNGHGYLFIDFKQQSNDILRVQTDITKDKRIVYIENK
jgi:hypothetical protein